VRGRLSGREEGSDGVAGSETGAALAIGSSVGGLIGIRVANPAQIAQAKASRRPAGGRTASDRLMIIAADHTARGALAAGGRQLAMADRRDLLSRLCLALSRPGVDGVLGTADIIEDLLLLGALEGKLVFGSMNRGGIRGTEFEVDDRFTAYTAEAIAASRFDGGKMLLRIDSSDRATADALHAAAQAINELATRELTAMVEPFISHRHGGRLVNDLSPDAVIRSVSIAAGLGATSAYTWLKLPVVEDMERVVNSSPLPVLLLGGEVGTDQDAMFSRWQRALALPTVRGLVVGRALLYPPDDNVPAAVDTAVGLLAPGPGR
jgi:hypothetical protein